MTDPNVKDFNPGGVKDRIDLRDYEWKELGFSTPPFNWKKGFDIEKALSDHLNVTGFKIPAKDQGPSSSCGGQAWSYYAQVLEAIHTGSFEERSAKYTYAQTYAPGGGSRGRENARVFVTQGVSREKALTSYEDGKPPSEAFMQRSVDITAEIRADAMLSRSLSYAQLELGGVLDIDSVAQAIEANNGVVLGIDGANNGTWKSEFPKPPKASDGRIWRHWVYAGRAKKINGKKYIGILNSWGADNGDRGWQWLSEEYFKTNVPIYNEKAVWSGWTHIFNPNPVPPAFHHVFNADMEFGQTGEEVKQLQTALQVEGQFPAEVPITGFYGKTTQAAVQKFQMKYKISSGGAGFGRCGPKTRAKLNELFGN